MSKADALRAMREARYEEGHKPAKKAKPAVAATPAEGLCGHRAISGKTCVRLANHTEKNHRYK